MSKTSEEEALALKLRKEIECESEEETDGNPMEFRIQTRRILQIYENVIKCCQLTFCLGSMIRDDCVMGELFDFQTRHEIEVFCEALNDGGYKNVLHQGMSPESLHFSSMFEKIMKSNLKTEIPQFIDHISPAAKDFIESLVMLKSAVRNRIQKTAKKEMDKEKMLHRLYLGNLKNEEKVNALQKRISELEDACKKNLEDKYVKIEQFKEQIEVMKDTSRTEIEQHLFESDKVMLRQCKDSDKKQAELRENVEKVSDRYHKTLDANLRTERALREKKIKITQQLQQWIAKYDTDVGTRSKELAELTEKLNEEEAAFNKWYDEIFIPQEKNYHFLMDEKAEEERRVHEERLWMFMMNRAARLLQKYWRAMILKRKSKKGRKGRKAKK